MDQLTKQDWSQKEANKSSQNLIARHEGKVVTMVVVLIRVKIDAIGTFKGDRKAIEIRSNFSNAHDVAHRL